MRPTELVAHELQRDNAIADRGLAFRSQRFPTPHVALLGVWGLILATTILKFTLYSRQPLGLDETFTGMIASRPDLRDMLEQCQRDVYAPLSYMLSWAFAKVFGLSDGALRLPSVVFACAAPVLALAPGRLLPRVIRLAWAVLLACWLPSFLLAQTARCYALLLLLGTGNALAFVSLIRAPNLTRAAIWAGLSSLFILDHYFAAILVFCQGIAYLAVHRRVAVWTWPASLAFAPTFASILIKGPLLVSYARPGVSWMPRLRLNDLPQMANYLAGSTIVLYGILAWIGVGVVFNWRRWRLGLAARRGEPVDAGAVTAVVTLAAIGLCLALAFVKPILTPRYLTPFIPGVLLALAVAAQRFGRGWTLATASLLTVPVGVVLILAIRPPTGDLPTLAFEPAASWLGEARISRLVFFWDNPLAQTAISQQFANVGGFFFAREGRPVPVQVPAWANDTDPNPILLSDLQADGTGMIWIYDKDRPGTLARRYPPKLATMDPRLVCRNFAQGQLGVLACYRRSAAA
jgi:hypothetical protein